VAFQSLHDPLTFTITINTSGLREGNHIKERVKNKYMQRYKDKLNINSIVRVRPPTHDNLSILTTKELDDYIQLERNRCQQFRRKSQYVKTMSDVSETRSSEIPESEHYHSKIFESSFLARLNKMVGEQREQNETNQ